MPPGQPAGRRRYQVTAVNAAASFPHLDHARFQLRSQLFVGPSDASLSLGGMIGSPNCIFSGANPLERFVSWPNFIEAFDRDGNDRYLHVNRQDGRTLLEDSRSAVDRALAFGIKNERTPLSQAKCTGTHSGNQIRVRVDDQ
jgi:hypothetical protein